MLFGGFVVHFYVRQNIINKITLINVFHSRKCWRKEAHGQEPNQTNSFKDFTTKKIKAQCMLKNFALSFTATNHDFGKNKMDMSIIQS